MQGGNILVLERLKAMLKTWILISGHNGTTSKTWAEMEFVFPEAI